MKYATSFARPTVIVSNCLCEAPCRWDGDRLGYPFVRSLRRYAKVVGVCPEVEIGLGVPRDRIILVKRPSGVALYQPASGRQCARKMNSFARQFLESHTNADGFILKHKSPSCGPRQVKLYESGAPNAAFVRQGTGLFAARVLAQFPHAAIEDEDRLENDHVREHWLTKLFALAAFRAVRKSNSLDHLQSYHAYYQSLLTAHNKRLTRELARILLQSGAVLDSYATIEQYKAVLHRILAKPPRRTSIVKPFESALEQYAQFLNRDGKKRFRRLCERYLAGHTPLAELRKTVQIWAVRYDKMFTRAQAVFRPYPAPLADA